MPHVTMTKEWTSPAPPAEVAAKAKAALQKAGIAVTSPPNALTLDFTGGSGCMTRLIGGWFVGLGTLPKKGTLWIAESPEGSTVKLYIEDALGPALVDPAFRKRFEQSFEEVAAAAAKATG